jgi:hemerythrin
MENVRRDNTVEMLAFLNGWLVQHIAGRDMEYVPYLIKAKTTEQKSAQN